MLTFGHLFGSFTTGIGRFGVQKGLGQTRTDGQTDGQTDTGRTQILGTSTQ